MIEAQPLSVELIAWPQFRVPRSMRERYSLTPTEARGDYGSSYRYSNNGDGQDLVEFAGRACYQSWPRPNPKTATNEGYLAHILEVEHFSVLEHASYSFYVAGVSRSLTHELIRHRHLSPSQLSQRYVDSSDMGLVIPPLVRGDAEIEADLVELQAHLTGVYEGLALRLQARLAEAGVAGTAARKQAREAARAVLPNMTETRLVLTANLRAWRYMISKRATVHADREIRELAVEVCRQLSQVAPHAMQDADIERQPDGTEIVTGLPDDEGWERR